MFERFTERARQVVILAQDEAHAMKHGYIGTEHLLLGLLREQEGMAARALASLNMNVDDVRTDVLRIVGSAEGDKPQGQIPFTPRCKKVIELSLREAMSLGHNYIGTEHLLLGLVRENEGVAARILAGRDVDAAKVRDEIIRLLSGPRKVAERSNWEVEDVNPGGMFIREGVVYEVVGLYDSPTVLLEEVGSKERRTCAVDSPWFSECAKLVAERKEAS